MNAPEQDHLIQVAIVAPAQAIRAGLRSLLSADDRINVVSEAAITAALAELQHNPDVLIVAGSQGLGDGEFFERLAEQGESLPAVLLLSDHPEDLLPWTHYPLAAWGLLSLDASPEELTSAIHALYQGLLVGAPHLLEPLLRRGIAERTPLSSLEIDQAPVEQLTARELEVLQRLAQGLANKQIAAALNISEHTVKFHVSSIYSKLGAANRTEAVRTGVRLGLIIL